MVRSAVPDTLPTKPPARSGPFPRAQRKQRTSVLLSIIGWIGAIVILAGYALFSLGKLPNGPVYQLSNLVGAACISVNVASHGAWPSTLVNGVWAIIAAVVLVRMARSRARARRAAELARHDEAHERRIHAAERADLSPAFPAGSLPVVTAALAVVALAAVQQHDPDRAPGADDESSFASGAAASGAAV